MSDERQAPVVPNDAWSALILRTPARCSWLHRRHRWFAPDAKLPHRLVCSRNPRHVSYRMGG